LTGGFLPSFSSFGQAVSEGNIFRTAKFNNCIWRPCLLTNRNQLSNTVNNELHKYTDFSIVNRSTNLFCKLSKGDIKSNKRIISATLLQCALVLFEYSSAFRRIIFRNLPPRNKNCKWSPYL
jgi:hypothetical protein